MVELIAHPVKKQSFQTVSKEETNFKELKESVFFRLAGNKGNGDNRKDEDWNKTGRRGKTEQRIGCLASWCFL